MSNINNTLENINNVGVLLFLGDDANVDKKELIIEVNKSTSKPRALVDA
ncbi:MAG: hypothetical protein ACRDA4_03005 [Filifactoraceae bacterium]